MDMGGHGFHIIVGSNILFIVNKFYMVQSCMCGQRSCMCGHGWI